MFRIKAEIEGSKLTTLSEIYANDGVSGLSCLSVASYFNGSVLLGAVRNPPILCTVLIWRCFFVERRLPDSFPALQLATERFQARNFFCSAVALLVLSRQKMEIRTEHSRKQTTLQPSWRCLKTSESKSHKQFAKNSHLCVFCCAFGNVHRSRESYQCAQLMCTENVKNYFTSNGKRQSREFYSCL